MKDALTPDEARVRLWAFAQMASAWVEGGCGGSGGEWEAVNASEADLLARLTGGGNQGSGEGERERGRGLASFPGAGQVRVPSSRRITRGAENEAAGRPSLPHPYTLDTSSPSPRRNAMRKNKKVAPTPPVVTGDVFDLQGEAMQIVRDTVRVAGSPAALFEEDGVDERLFAARIEGVAKRYCETRETPSS